MHKNGTKTKHSNIIDIADSPPEAEIETRDRKRPSARVKASEANKSNWSRFARHSGGHQRIGANTMKCRVSHPSETFRRYESVNVWREGGSTVATTTDGKRPK
ncbi:hypothetical protein V6N12_064644 [Hibiscus sabdariffa]|uniref:Uncharacterized protein n=1 Tax=Hibiscus sabdariffa TaxID=183260 RepID=A0ABR2G6F5_9ROSI